ncbi:MAG: pilus assembly protein [Rhodobacter sp.]|uniref:TadE/TadG family type IV pilus assembly protein n=1 Tax=Pararhodobacter sp. TaxID=2127056 RepID=UPI001E078AAE|nr:TadE/TadG family type IV pilus assembly protein [Pararhodobacter sp.]MCB1344762.1 pilus assembly protein [Paracoccaceae bacterium]MCC0074161.1 pilus assembly protein [Rhodobacter sp.]HPD92957.1 pilus assembly protein [Pararhodobacter sp.]
MTWLATPLRRFLRSDRGTATIEFVIGIPLILAFLFSAIDYGTVMLRQVFLDRSVDIAVRQVRLGAITGNDFQEFRAMVCRNSFLISDCENSIAIELRPIDTETWAGLDTPAQCVNRAENLSPVLAFTPSAGQQQLMLIRVCAVVDPFIRMTGMVLGMPDDGSGGFFLVSRAAFANEPA